MSELSDKIKNIRLSLGETMEEFGSRFNTSKATINDWEKGRNKPNKNNLLLIANLGGFSVEELLLGDKHVYLENKISERISYLIENVENEDIKTFIKKYKNEIFKHTINKAKKISITEFDYSDIDDFVKDDLYTIIHIMPHSTIQALNGLAIDLDMVTLRYYATIGELEEYDIKINEIDRNTLLHVLQKVTQLSNEIRVLVKNRTE